MKIIALCVASLFACTAFAQSFAQSRELSVSAGWSLLSSGYIGTDQLTGGNSHDLQLKGGFLFAVRFDANQGSHFGHEVQYMNSRMPVQYNYEGGAKLGGAMNRFGYNFIGYFNSRTEARVRVFGTVGGQFTLYSRPSDSGIGCESADCTVASQPPTTGGNQRFGFNVGAGAKVSLTPRFGLRFDVRQYMDKKPWNLTLSPGGLLQQTELSVGLGARF